jgi:hypothetical protein
MVAGDLGDVWGIFLRFPHLERDVEWWEEWLQGT